MKQESRIADNRSSKVKSIIFALAAVSFLAFVGYSIWRYVNRGPARLPAQDVLLAQDCGMDGLQCCASDPKCSFGQECCADPNNSGKNQCADKCECGKQDEFCCADNQCSAGFACVDSKCTACGHELQPCCGSECQGGGKKNNSPLACFQQKCVECGLIGNPCCGSEKCFGSESTEKTLAECKNGLCDTCGGNQQPACFGQEKCLRGYLLNNDNCFKCGGENEPCCEGFRCEVKSKLRCAQGFCQ